MSACLREFMLKFGSKRELKVIFISPLSGRDRSVVGGAGLEPAASCTSSRCSPD